MEVDCSVQFRITNQMYSVFVWLFVSNQMKVSFHPRLRFLHFPCTPFPTLVAMFIILYLAQGPNPL